MPQSSFEPELHGKHQESVNPMHSLGILFIFLGKFSFLFVYNSCVHHTPDAVQVLSILPDVCCLRSQLSGQLGSKFVMKTE